MYFAFFRGTEAPEGEGPDGGAAAHQFTRVDGYFAAIADDDDAAALREQLQVMRQVHIGKHFQNDVQAPAGRGLQNLVLIARLAVIEHLARPLASGKVQAFLCTSSS